MTKKIKMPKLSGDMENGVIVAWNKEPGDIVNKGDILYEVETDKVVIEVESTETGILKEVYFEEGDNVSVDEIVAEFEIEEQ